MEQVLSETLVKTGLWRVSVIEACQPTGATASLAWLITCSRYQIALRVARRAGLPSERVRVPSHSRSPYPDRLSYSNCKSAGTPGLLAPAFRQSLRQTGRRATRPPPARQPSRSGAANSNCNSPSHPCRRPPSGLPSFSPPPSRRPVMPPTAPCPKTAPPDRPNVRSRPVAVPLARRRGGCLGPLGGAAWPG
jgi:hypothetical protein